MVLFLLALLGMSLAGAAVLRRIAPQISIEEALGAGFVVGVSANAWVLQIAFGAGVPPGAATWIVAGAVSLVLAGALSRSPLRSMRSWARPRKLSLPSPAGAVLAALVAALVALALSWPVTVWDAQDNWVAKGRGLLIDGGLAGVQAGRWPHYPVGLPVVHSGALALGGEPAVKIVAPLYAAALAAVVAGAVGRRGPRWVGHLTAMASVASPVMLGFAIVAYADVPFAAAATISLLYVLEFAAHLDSRVAWLAALAGAASTLLRPEAPLLLATQIPVLAMLASGAGRFVWPLRFIGVFAVAWVPWQVLSRIVINVADGDLARAGVLPADIANGNVDWDRLGVIGSYFGQTAVSPTTWGLAFVVMLAGIGVLLVRRRRVGVATLLLMLLNSLAMFVLLYSVPEPDRFLVDPWLVAGFDRLALHWVPVGTVVAGLALQDLLGGARQRCGLHRPAVTRPWVGVTKEPAEVPSSPSCRPS